MATTNRLSPADLHMLLNIYAIPGPPSQDWKGSATLTAWLNDGTVCKEAGKGEGCFFLTDKGEKWLNMILSTPQPENRWCDPRIKTSE